MEPLNQNQPAGATFITKIPELYPRLPESNSLEVRPRSLCAKHTLEVVSDNH